MLPPCSCGSFKPNWSKVKTVNDKAKIPVQFNLHRDFLCFNYIPERHGIIYKIGICLLLKIVISYRHKERLQTFRNQNNNEIRGMRNVTAFDQLAYPDI